MKLLLKEFIYEILLKKNLHKCLIIPFWKDVSNNINIYNKKVFKTSKQYKKIIIFVQI